MPRFLHPIAGAALLMAVATVLPTPVPAQSDPAAQSLIDQLRPHAGSGTRGIRLPSAEPSPAPAAAQAPSQPALPAATAAPTVPTRHASPPAAAPRLAAANTAPAGAAVSITVNFPSGSATLTPRAEHALAPLGRALSSVELAPYRFRIEGHTDTVGEAETNLRLSERRASAVRDLLVQKYGVAPGRLEVIGLGESRPLVPTPDETSDQRNRRVQVINLDG
jgi:OmpA-OmpF porin, OOP family